LRADICLFCHSQEGSLRADRGPVLACSPIFRKTDAYNSGMITLRAPTDVSEALRHAIELVNRDLDEFLDDLDRNQQNQFWSNLHQYALAQTQHKGRDAHLIAAPEVDEGVREALEMADERITDHLESLARADAERFWQVLHEASEEQAHAMPERPKGRHGGGKR
jgi:hypothetical protein